MKSGDAVELTYQGLTVDAVVVLASKNGRSLFLSFEALLGGYTGEMPVLRDDQGTYRDLINSEPVGLKEKA